jgi:ABC-type polysaccharide/polyol phosphate export permease
MVPAGFELLVTLNPLSYLIDGYRGALMFNRLPSVAGLVTFASLAFVTLLTGYRHFMRLRRELPDFV